MKRMISLATLLLMMWGFAPAHASGTEIIAGPTDPYTGTFTTPITITQVGGPLTFGNIDVEARGLESDAKGPDSNSWCSRYAAGQCPLFWAHSIDVIYHTTAVLGLNQLVSGQTYTFHDTTSPQNPVQTSIKGILIAV